MSNRNIDWKAAADAIVQARRSGKAASAADFDGAIAGLEEAYAAQRRVADEMGWFDASSQPAIVAWKSGGAARDVPLTHAQLPSQGVRNSPADLSDMPFFAPAIEAEIALRLGREIGPDEVAQLADPSRLIDAMCVSIEVVDSSWREGADAPPMLKLADAQSHGALVLGEWTDFNERDWRFQRCEVNIAGTRQEFTGTHALGYPAWLLPKWLHHATLGGDLLPAGTVVTTGTWCGLLPARRGDEVRVVFDGIGEATLRL